MGKKNGCLLSIVGILFIGVIFMGMIIKEVSPKGNDSSSSGSKEIVNYIGKKGKIGKLELTVNSVEKADEISAGLGFFNQTPKSGKFCIVNITINNPTKNSESLFLNSFKLVGPDGAEYAPSMILGADEDYLTIDNLNPNLKVEGNIAFEVPEGLEVYKCELKYNNNHEKFYLRKQ